MVHDLLRQPHTLEFHVLDIGQGDALLLRTPEQHNILVDGGPGNTVLTELSEVLPESFREIDLMILTHPHLDHMEGLISVLERFDVNAVMMSAPSYDSLVYSAFLNAVEKEKCPVYFADDETDFIFGALNLDVLYPFEAESNRYLENINNASPVIKVDDWLLLTGDAEIEVEEELLAAGVDLNVDILKAGHHGSRTSSSWEFLNAVSPKLMLISAGHENSFGHPHIETLEKASELDIEVWRTDLDGRLFYPLDLGP